jgi:SAM-dependent methyltransferase
MTVPMARSLVIDPSDFSALYLSDHEQGKTARRTREWTIPQLEKLGVMGGRVLSIGCANGVDVLEMRKRGYDANGIDLYPPCKQAEPWCSIAPATAIPFPDGTFAAIVMLEVIEHIPSAQRQAVASECCRALRKGGVIIIATPNRFFPLDEHGEPFRVHSPFQDDTLTAREIEQLFGGTAQCLSWSKYFAFERIPAAVIIKPFIRFLEWPLLHRSPFNPHLFLALRPSNR